MATQYPEKFNSTRTQVSYFTVPTKKGANKQMETHFFLNIEFRLYHMTQVCNISHGAKGKQTNPHQRYYYHQIHQHY